MDERGSADTVPTAVGGVIATGAVIVTDGATALVATRQVRSAVSRSPWPAVSVARTCTIQESS